MMNYQLSDILKIIEKSFKEIFSWFSFRFQAEVQRVTIVGKNTYLDLVEFNENGEIKAKCKWICFDEEKYKQFLKDINIKTIDEIKWYKLLMEGKVNFHQDYWLSIFISQFSSEFTLWQFQKKQENILEQLKKEGIINKNKEKKLWFPPYTIGIISWESSQWLQDFQTILKQSWYHYNSSMYYSSIHWNEATKQVHEKLLEIKNDILEGKKIDLVVIVRWWGESSWIIRQNDSNIAKDICLMPVPVMTAIGHTTDISILDAIVKYAAKTPSDAAYLLINEVKKYQEELDTYRQSLKTIVNNKFWYIQQQVDHIYEKIRSQAKSRIETIKKNIEKFIESINAYDPKKLTKRWYALLSNEKWEYIGKKNLKTLKQEDTITISMYDKTITAKIEKIS